jgi:hypothetical protein
VVPSLCGRSLNDLSSGPRAQEHAYPSIDIDAEGRLSSRTFPGLVLDVPALLDDDVATVLEGVQAHTGSETHQAFVRRLQG